MKRITLAIPEGFERRLLELRRKIPSLRNQTTAVLHAAHVGLEQLGIGAQFDDRDVQVGESTDQ